MDGNVGGYVIASWASWDNLDLIDRLGRGLINRSGNTDEGVSGDERYDESIRKC